MSLTQDTKKEIERFLREGKKIGAIKYLKDTYGFSLDESKTLVEAMEHQMQEATEPLKGVPPMAVREPDDAMRTAVVTLLRQGRKIEAVKTVKDGLKIRLKDAKDWVEALEHGTTPILGRVARHGMTRGATGLVLGIFVGVGVILLGGAAWVYFAQTRSIEQSDLIQGKVVRLQQNDDGMSAPVIEYEWQGQKWIYASTTYSSPPAFFVDEVVPVYVNRHDPDDITVNTFSERWLLIMILGTLGAFFIGLPTFIVYLTGRTSTR